MSDTMNKDIMYLAAKWLDAKQDEREATAGRISIENQILELVDVPEEGSKTIKEQEFKLTVTQRINRKVDDRKWSLVKDEIPETLRPVEMVETLKIDNRGVQWLRDNEPGYYKLLCSAMTEKPAKVGITVEVIK